MNKTFRPWTIDQPLLLPARVQDFVGEDPLARFVLALVLDHLDLREIEGGYGSERGQPPFDPAMMTALLLYAYCNGVYSSRRIAKASRERVDFMSVVGLDAPDFHTVSDFRKRHLKALAGLFTRNPPGRAAVKLGRAGGGRTSSSKVGVCRAGCAGSRRSWKECRRAKRADRCR